MRSKYSVPLKQFSGQRWREVGSGGGGRWEVEVGKGIGLNLIQLADLERGEGRRGEGEVREER